MLDDDACMRALRREGMTDVPERFGIAHAHQLIPHDVLAGVDRFIRVFDRVTAREAWQRTATATCPAIARAPRTEHCFFSAWDVHVPPDRPDEWKLIEFNDNGSGFLFSAIVNWHCAVRAALSRPEDVSSFRRRVADMIRAEAASFFGGPLRGAVLIVDDRESLESGRFRDELVLLRDLCRAAGWHAEIAAPEDTQWDGERLTCRGEVVGFIINRSTDFWWAGDGFAALRAAYASESVYAAPNPFTYATRSDKRLLEWLSRPVRDAELGIAPDERAVLGAHVAETFVLDEANVDALARERDALFFKPCHGFASHGLLTGAQVGRTRLRRLLKKGEPYVAQRSAPKRRLETRDGVPLWADLRVWAYRGERYLVSGRASRVPERLDLAPPGGWLPTYACGADH